MDKRFWERPVCFICDYWWVALLLIAALVAGLLAWNHYFPPEPQLGTGDVQVTLRWGNLNDIDLHVISPNGEHLYFEYKNSTDGGILDVDTNAGCGESITNRPVENIYWPQGAAPHGSYQVFVLYYAQCQDAAFTDYTVTITVDGKKQEFQGSLQQVGETQEVIIFNR